MGTQQLVPRAADVYFMHATPAEPVVDAPLQNATRYLCAAAYLDPAYCDRVLKEYVGDDHRAVVPSYGFDLGPVILHCLRARRLRLCRDLILAAVLIAGMLLIPLATGTLIALALLLVAPIFLVPWRRLGWRLRLAVGYLLLIILPQLGYWFVRLVNEVDETTSQGATGFGGTDGFGGTGESGGTGGEGVPRQGFLDSLQDDHLVALMVLLAVILLLVTVGHTAVVYESMSRTLAPGARHTGPRTRSKRVRTLLVRIAAAQRGNVTLYSGENPFMGAGDVKAPWARAWSVVLEVDRPGGGPLGRSDRAEAVDPVTLHQWIQARLRAMRDEYPETARDAANAAALPPNERIAGLVTDMHVVGRGDCAQYPRAVDPATSLAFKGHPLIDAERGVPYSIAGPAAVEAIIRHPQGGIRCYQRITVGAQGQAIWGRHHRPLAPAEDQDIALSAFIYLAVEGRMLYGQFVATVLPPVRREYRLVDVLPAWSVPTVLWRACASAAPRTLSCSLLSWWQSLRTAGHMVTGAMNSTFGPEPGTSPVHDYGARISVRELAADPDFHTFMQELDADKYLRMIERRINEAVLDHLQERKVDVTAYREQAATVLNSPFIMTGGSISGSQIAVGGAGAHITQEHGRF